MNNQFFLNYFGLSSLLSTVPHSLIFLFQVWLLEPLWLHFIRRNNSAQYVSRVSCGQDVLQVIVMTVHSWQQIFRHIEKLVTECYEPWN